MSLQNIDLVRIEFSHTPAQELRREQLDQGKLAELAASIRAVGVLQPILVRRLEKDGRYQCVAGERRVNAAHMAGLEQIPATVRDLTDEHVVELQLIENLQRQDLHELAEAEGYEQLLQLGIDVDGIAAKVGKSKATIYARMKLLALTPAARKAFYQGKIAASVALLLARIPVPKLQDQALKEVSAVHNHTDDTGDRAGNEVEYQDQMSVRAATAHIHQNYMLRLGDAGFPTGDATLVPSAGACGSCPKRTGNQPELFGDVKGADVCTDPVCFKQKIAAHAERVLAAAKETGQKVIAGKDAEKLARYGLRNHVDGMTRLDSTDYHAGSAAKKRTYRQTLGKDYVPTLVQDPDTGKMIEFAPDRDIEKARAKANAEKPGSGGREDTYKKQQRAIERKHRLAIAYRVALFKAVRQASPKRKTLDRGELETVAECMYGRLDHDSTTRLYRAWGLDPKKRKGGYGLDMPLPTPIKQLLDDELVQLVRDVALAHELQQWQHGGNTAPTDLEAAAKRVGVNAAAIKRSIDEEAAAKKAKRAPKPKAAKRATAPKAKRPRKGK